MEPEDIHVMVDLETMGNGSNAAIVSIGAVKFDPTAAIGKVIESFEATINLESAFAHGQVTAGTVEWWMHPDRAEARAVWLDAQKVDLFDALDGFAQWFGPKSLPLWGNGATFDNVILRNAFKHLMLPEPWNFYDDRCFRTLKNLHPLPSDYPLPEPAVGVPHAALYDATKQAYQMQAIDKQMTTMKTAEVSDHYALMACSSPNHPRCRVKDTLCLRYNRGHTPSSTTL